MPDEAIVMTPQQLQLLTEKLGVTVPEGTNFWELHKSICAELTQPDEKTAPPTPQPNVVDLDDPAQFGLLMKAVETALAAKSVPKPPPLWGAGTREPMTLQKIISTPIEDAPDEDLFRKVCAKSDHLLVQSALMSKPGAPCDPRSLKSWQTHFGPDGKLRKAMDTATAGEGTEWIPTGFSDQVITAVWLKTGVAALFERVPMPTSPYKVPALTGDLTWYLMPEALEDESTKIPVSNLTSGALTFTAKKPSARLLYSDELDEDAAFAMAQRLLAEIPNSAARMLDEVIVDGDTTAAHVDLDVVNPLDRRKCWRGLRKLALTLTSCSADWSSWAAATAWPLAVGAIKVMGKYAADPARNAWIVGPKTGAMLMLDTNVIQVAAMGPQAAVIQGQVASYVGRPVIMHGLFRETLNASGYSDATASTYTGMLLVSKSALVIGDRRQLTIEQGRLLAQGQREIVVTLRADVQYPFGVAAGSGKVVYYGYKMS